MQTNTSTWGGHPIYDEASKLWHGYFAEITNHCLLNAWKTNSITVHTTSASAVGPFKFKSVVQPAWSHNPLVSRDPATGEILIAHIGCGTIAPGKTPQNCSRTTGAMMFAEVEATASGGGAAAAAAAAASGGGAAGAGMTGLPPCECSDGVGGK
jgi:hypothetical protein